MNINERLPLFARFTRFILLREIDSHCQLLERLFSLFEKFNSTSDVPFVAKTVEIILSSTECLDKLALVPNFVPDNPIELKASENLSAQQKNIEIVLFC